MAKERRGRGPVSTIDAVFEKADPTVVAAGLLGAIATAGGITPPLTRLLDVMTSKDITDDIARAFDSLVRYGGLGLGPAGLMALFVPPPSDATEEAKADYRRTMGLMASGAMEGMIMMTLVSNKEFMSQLLNLGGKLGAATITAAGEAVPF